MQNTSKRVTSKMDAQQKQLKGLRFIFLKNDEDLSDDTKSIHAKIAFHRWIKLAEETQIPELRTWRVPFGINSYGIVRFWTFRHITNASMERFNNNIQWLIKQAYRPPQASRISKSKVSSVPRKCGHDANFGRVNSLPDCRLYQISQPHRPFAY